MNATSFSSEASAVHRKRKGISVQDIASLVTVGLLIAQAILLVLLTQRVTVLQQALSGSAPSGNPMVLERNPDERGQVIGPANAPVTVVEFSDFECPFCAQGSATVKSLLAQYPGQIRLVYRHNPLQGVHPNAQQAAEASECAARQNKFWEMHDLLFANYNRLSPQVYGGYAAQIGLDMGAFDTCMSQKQTTSLVQQDLADGRKYRVDGTPTFFVNKVMVAGDRQLEAAVRQALKNSQ